MRSFHSRTARAVLPLGGRMSRAAVGSSGAWLQPTLHSRRGYGFLGKGAAAQEGATAAVNTAAEEAASFAQTAAASAAAAAAAPPPAGGPSTYFDYMDSLWSRKWFGTVDDASAASAASAAADPETVSRFAEAFLSVQSGLGLEAWAAILLFGGITRLATLVFSFYGERAGARMQLALPELKAPQEAFNKVYYNDTSSALDVQLSATALKSERRRVFAKYKTSNTQCLASFASSPFIVYGLYQISQLCVNPLLEVGTSSFFWCTALTLPDPFFILPIAFCGLTLLNFELSISAEMKKGWMSNVIWGARLGCLCVIPVAATFRSGVALYFIGMSLAGLLQPLLLRTPAFRRAIGFPAPTVQETAQKELKNADELQARMTVQFPYLSHLLNPEVEDDNEHLFKSAAASAATPARGGGRSVRPGGAASAGVPRFTPVPPEGRRYTAGSNPLMRETPLNRRQKDSAADDKAATPTPKKQSGTPGRGSAFASSGWKATHLTFSEEDFIPSSFEQDKRSSPTTTGTTKRG